MPLNNRPSPPKAAPRILGIDASLNGTGLYGLPDGRATKIIPPKKIMGMARLNYLRDTIRELLREYNPTVVAIEGYSYGSKGRGLFGIAEWGGVLRMELADFGLPYAWILPPHNLKKFVIGHAKQGESGKEVMILKTFQRWKIEFSDNDLCDAHGLARAASILEGHTIGMARDNDALGAAEKFLLR